LITKQSILERPSETEILPEDEHNELTIVGTSPELVGSREKVSGKAVYTVDMKLPGMIYGKILRSPHAHAKIIKIDTKKAEAYSGVRATLTHKEARILYQSTYGNAKEYALDEKVRYFGDKVAAIAADTEQIAEEALKLIEVDYEVLKAALTIEEALKPDASLIHPQRDDVKGNLLQYSRQSYCDIEKGFAEADYIIMNKFTTSRVCHCALEPHVMIADWDSSGNLTMWSSEQTAFMIRDSLAEALDIPRNKVRFIVPPYVGGGFGGKYESTEKIICAQLAKKAGRPVMMRLSREEEFYTTRTRSPCVFETKTGVKKDGTLTARYIKGMIDVGSYAWGSIMASRAGSYLTMLYKCSNILYEGYGVFTNTPPSGAMRGFTSTPIHFAMESEIDDICFQIGMDPLEFRLKNRLKVGDIIPLNGRPVTSSGLEESMLRGAKAIGWEKRQRIPGAEGGIKKLGIGMACYSHYSPMLLPTERSIGNAVLKANIDGSFHLLLGIPDIGQGLRTVMAQICAEALGARLDEISLTLADTSVTPWGPATAASRSTIETGGAVKKAAEEVKAKMFELASHIMKVPVASLDVRESRVFVKGSPEKGVTFEDILNHPKVFLGGENEIVVKATYSVPDFVPPYGAQFAEVEVDTETGEVKVIKVVAASDVGRAINPKSVEGQLEGGIHMGLGFALSEELVLDPCLGRPLNPSFLDYKLFRASDMPEIEILIVEPVDPISVYGVKGIGEMAVIATAPAVRNAIFNATGARLYDLPITPERILKALKEKSSPSI
jgi:xanthine dehydrogenase molybdenum-binding subunit